MVNFGTLSWPTPSKVGTQSCMINTWEHRHSINPRGRNHWARLYDRNTTQSTRRSMGFGDPHAHRIPGVGGTGVCDSIPRNEAIGPPCGQIMLIWAKLGILLARAQAFGAKYPGRSGRRSVYARLIRKRAEPTVPSSKSRCRDPPREAMQGYREDVLKCCNIIRVGLV